MSIHHKSGTAGRRLARWLQFAALAVLLTAWLSGCGKGRSEQTSALSAVDGEVQAADPMRVTLRPSMISRLVLSPVTRERIAETNSVPGRIEADASKLERIGASVTGRVVELFVNVGDTVRPGQALASLSSPELTQAQVAYLRASSAATLAERAAERARQLFSADALGAAELQKREAEAAVSRAEAHAAADQLKLLGVPGRTVERLRERGAVDPNAMVMASSHGVVIERNVSKGQVVQPADKLFVVADLSSVWAVGGAPEQAARRIARGQQVAVDVPALDNASFLGSVVFVADTVDAVTRTVQVRTEVKNLDRKLKPEMLANLRVSAPPTEALVVPVGAVVRDNDRDHVFIKQADNVFRLVPVDLGPAIGGLRPVLRGVSEGQVIVASGAFHVNNERKRAELE